MAKRSLILTSTAAGTGKKLQKAISDINPQASAEALKGFTQKLNALTTNTYVQTDCIDKFNVDTEIPPVDNRQEPTVEFDNDFWLKVTKEEQLSGIETNSDGEFSVEVHGMHRVAFGFVQTSKIQVVSHRLENNPTPGQVTLRISGTETFKPYEQTFDFTV